MESSSLLKATKEHCYYCFQTLLHNLEGKAGYPAWPEFLKSGKCPLFVTWYIGKDEDLRGCIGTFGAEDIKKLLPKYALTSAFNDSRFPPIKQKEVSDLTCGVSFLGAFENGKDAYDWTVGIHGIQIEFTDTSGRHYNATFLPEVASENNWTKETTLQHLIRKAGYKSDYKDVVSRIKLERYQSSKEKVSFNEFKNKA